MQIIRSYQDLRIGKLQKARLYAQGRPLSILYKKQQRGMLVNTTPELEILASLITEDYVAVDCAGWFFHQDGCQCIAVETQPLAQTLWPQVHIEYDYMTHCPTYLNPMLVVCYHSPEFKYSSVEQMVTFLKIWMPKHKKIILSLDHTKVKFNYFKYKLADILHDATQYQIQVIHESEFSTTCTVLP